MIDGILDYVEDVKKRLVDRDHELAVIEKALELACQDCPIHCPDLPEKFNLQYEYGSDEPYWVEEGGCEFDDPEMCLECNIQYYKQRAKELLGENNNG